jgi:hypothetical protein
MHKSRPFLPKIQVYHLTKVLDSYTLQPYQNQDKVYSNRHFFNSLDFHSKFKPFFLSWFLHLFYIIKNLLNSLKPIFCPLQYFIQSEFDLNINRLLQGLIWFKGIRLLERKIQLFGEGKIVLCVQGQFQFLLFLE